MKEKAAADAADFALDQLGEKAVSDSIKPLLKRLRKVSRTNPIADLILNPSTTARFDGLPNTGGDMPEILSKNEFNQLLRETGIDAAALGANYDLYSPGELAKYNADLRRLMMQKFMLEGINDGRLRYLAVEVINYDRLHLEQLEASIPIYEDVLPAQKPDLSNNTQEQLSSDALDTLRRTDRERWAEHISRMNFEACIERQPVVICERRYIKNI